MPFSRTTVRSVPCPACFAPAEVACALARVRRDGRRTRYTNHQERHDAYRRRTLPPVNDARLERSSAFLELDRRRPPSSATPIVPAVGQVWRKLYASGEKVHDFRLDAILDENHASAAILNHPTNCKTRVRLDRLGTTYSICGELFRSELVNVTTA